MTRKIIYTDYIKSRIILRMLYRLPYTSTITYRYTYTRSLQQSPLAFDAEQNLPMKANKLKFCSGTYVSFRNPLNFVELEFSTYDPKNNLYRLIQKSNYTAHVISIATYEHIYLQIFLSRSQQRSPLAFDAEQNLPMKANKLKFCSGTYVSFRNPLNIVELKFSTYDTKNNLYRLIQKSNYTAHVISIATYEHIYLQIYLYMKSATKPIGIQCKTEVHAS